MSEKNQEQKKSDVASDKTSATQRADELLNNKKQVSSVKTRKASDVATLKINLKEQKYDKNSNVFKKRASYLLRDYQKVVSDSDNEIVIDTTTDLNTEMCIANNLTFMCNRYISTDFKINRYISSSQIIANSKNKGASFGDCNRRAMQKLAKDKAIVILTKDEMIEKNLAVDASKYYYRLNTQSAIVKTRIAQLKIAVVKTA
jgi:hypothetical protein